MPQAGSSLPGAPASGPPLAGLEYHNPLLFADPEGRVLAVVIVVQLPQAPKDDLEKRLRTR